MTINGWKVYYAYTGWIVESPDGMIIGKFGKRNDAVDVAIQTITERGYNEYAKQHPQ